MTATDEPNTLPFPSPSPSASMHQNPAIDPPTSSCSSSAPRPRMPYYTPANPRQFSSSAAKRESVMALGSIAHLQHYFVRNGLATKNRSASHKNMTLALPGRDPDFFSEEDEEALQNLPPEPAPPPPKSTQPSFPPGRALPNLTDLESARQEVMAQLDQVCEAWGLVQLSATRAPSVASNRSGDDDFNPSPTSTGFQNLQLSSQFASLKRENSDHGEGFVINLLALTTRAVRSVQKFILTIPDPDVFSSSNIAGLGAGLERRISHLELSTAARPRTSRSTLLGPSSSGLSTPSRSESPAPPDHRRATSGFDPFALFKKRANAGSIMTSTNSPMQTTKDDPLSILRKISLEVLGCLKDIEHKFRIPGSATPTDNHDQSICPSDHNNSMQTSKTESKVFEQDHENQEGVVLLPSMSWEYRQDINLEEVRKEAMVVQRWLECVDGILEGMKIITGSQRPNSRLSSSKNRSKESTKQSKPGMLKERNVFKKILGSSKFVSNHSGNDDTKVPHISFDNGTSGDESSSGDDEDEEELLPEWARNDRFILTKSSIGDGGEDVQAKEDDQLARLFSCLISHLPAELLPSICPPHGENGSRIGFLDSLSDGTVLCLAYNIVLKKSQRPWGFISVETIHNLVAPTRTFQSSFLFSSPRLTERSFSPTHMNLICEAPNEPDSRVQAPQGSRSNTRPGPSFSFSPTEIGESSFTDTSFSSASTAMNFNDSYHSPPKVGMTFRRMENIKVWAAALKLRYLIKSEIPSTYQDQSAISTAPATNAQRQTNNITSSSRKISHSGSCFKFDPLVIARKSDGWDIMLEFVACKWLDSIRSEKREEVLFSSK